MDQVPTNPNEEKDWVAALARAEAAQKVNMAQLNELLGDDAPLEPAPTATEPITFGSPVPGNSRDGTGMVELPPITWANEEEKSNEDVDSFIKEMGLESMIPAGFVSLEPAQKTKVLQDLKKRVVDLVKTDAKTQYSAYIKDKSFIKRIASSFVKEGDVRKFEREAFIKIKEDSEGKQIIAQDFERLVAMNRGRRIYTTYDGKSVVYYLEDLRFRRETTDEEARKIDDFEVAANKFAELPYEWGQEKDGAHRKEYDATQTQYEKSREEILKIKTRLEDPSEKGKAMLEMLKLDNELQMGQLLNTHPEAEKELVDFSKNPSAWENFKNFGTSTVKKVLGEAGANRQLFVGGYLTRLATVSIFGAIAAPAAGAIIGGLKGRLRAKQELEQRKKDARYGKEDASKEAVNTLDAVDLSTKLKTLTEGILFGDTEEEKIKKMDQLRRRIEFTQDKIEQGLVNFGDSKSALKNQFDLLRNLHVALSHAAMESTREDIDQRLEQFLAYKSGKIESAQKTFVNKQMIKGATFGASAATAGYLLRYFTEATEKAEQATDSEGFVDRAQKWMEKLKLWKKDAAVENAVAPEASIAPSAQNLQFNEYHEKLPGDTLGTTIDTSAPHTETVNNAFEGHNVKFEHGKGGIEGVKELRAQIREAYHGDYSNAPKSVQEFMSGDNAAKKAVELGLYDPSKAEESAMIHEGWELKFDKDGNLLFGKPDASGNIPKFGETKFEMFDSDKSGVEKLVPSEANAVPTPDTSAEDMDRLNQEKVEWLQKEQPGDTGSNDDELEGKSLEEQARTLKSLGYEGNPADKNAVKEFFEQQTREKVLKSYETSMEGTQEINHATNETLEELVEKELRNSPDNTRDVEEVFYKNTIKIFNLDNNDPQASMQFLKNMDTGFGKFMRETPAKELLRMKEDGNEGPIRNTSKYLKKLYEVTGLKPIGGFWRKEESAVNYIIRAISEAKKIGRLEEVKLK